MKMLAQLDSQLQALQAQGLQRRLRVMQSPCAPNVIADGQAMLAFASNDYLGLASHPEIIEALREGASLYGVGSGASHLISGHSRAHALLEDALAEFLSPHIPQVRSLYFGSGYLANVAILTALVASHPAGQTTIFSADLNHASIIDGARLSKARIEVYPHQDMQALAQLLAASTAPQKIVVTDSVFSMEGTFAPLPQMLALCEQHDAYLVLDDAHGFACLGAQGRGALEHFALHSAHFVYMGTLGKGAGVGGAFVVAHASIIEWLLQRGRPYIYTTASPPALAHALLTSLQIIRGAEGQQRRAHLADLIRHWQQELSLQQWQRMPSACAIQPILIGPNQATVDAASALYAQGFWVPAIRPPTVPVNTARLRVSLCASHTLAQLRSLISAVQDLEKHQQEAA